MEMPGAAMLKVGDFPRINAKQFPDKVAIVTKNIRVTYREFNERINRLANNLTKLGIGKGDRVGNLFYNGHQILETFFALQKIGAVAVPLNFRVNPNELKWALDNTECRALVYSDRLAHLVAPVKQEFATVRQFISDGDNVPNGEFDLEKLCREGSTEEPDVEVKWEDWASFIFTGGTSGKPKAAIYTQRTYTFAALLLVHGYQWSHDIVYLNQPPLFHIGGMNTSLGVISVGGTVVLVDAVDPLEISRLIEREKVNTLCLMPPQTYLRIVEIPEIKNFDFGSVKLIMTSAGANTPCIVRKIHEVFPNASIRYGWGQTEVGGVGINHELSRQMVEHEPHKTLSVGKFRPLVEIKLVDENGAEVPDGEVGEAIVRSPAIFAGYYNRPELNAEVLKDGWVHTGDLFKRDKDGMLYLVDRKKDMLKVGGENVFSQEVEDVIRSHPAVENCAIVGIPDPKWGESILAVVKLATGAAATDEELTMYCKDRLSSYKKPQRYVFVNEFPISHSGKIQKFALREMYGQQ